MDNKCTTKVVPDLKVFHLLVSESERDTQERHNNQHMKATKGH